MTKKSPRSNSHNSGRNNPATEDPTLKIRRGVRFSQILDKVLRFAVNENEHFIDWYSFLKAVDWKYEEQVSERPALLASFQTGQSNFAYLHIVNPEMARPIYPAISISSMGDGLLDEFIYPSHLRPGNLEVDFGLPIVEPWLDAALDVVTELADPLLSKTDRLEDMPVIEDGSQAVIALREEWFSRYGPTKYFNTEDQRFRWRAASGWSDWEAKRVIWKERATDMEKAGFKAETRGGKESDAMNKAMIRRLQRFRERYSLSYFGET